LTFSLLLAARRFRVPLLVLLGAAVLGLGAESLRGKIESFQPLGFEAVAAGDHWSVRSVAPEVEGGLRADDRIVLVDGVEVAKAGELRARLRAAPEAQLVVVRADRLETVRYHRPAVDLDLPYLVLVFIGLGYLLIGLYTLWRVRDGTVFYLWCLASAALYVCSPVFPVDRIGQWVFVADELARIFLPALTLHLFLTVPRALAPASRTALPFVYLPASVLAALQADLFLFDGRWVFGRPSAAALALLDRLDLVHLLLFAGASIVVLAQRLKRVENWEQHRQLLWLLVGMTCGYAPFFALYGLPHLAGIRLPELASAAAVLPLLSVPLAFAYAILRFRLWDLGLIVRNGLSYTLTLVAGLSSFSLVDLAIRRNVPESLDFTRDLLTFFGGLLIVGLVVPAHRGIHGALERLQYGRAFGRRRGLIRLGAELLQERDLDRLCAALLSELAQGLDLERVNLYLAQGGSLVAVRPEPGLPAALGRETLPERFWSGDFETLGAEVMPGEPPSAEQRLHAAGYRYVFPLAVRGAQVGLAAASLRRDGRPLDSEDVEIVRSLLDQAALAIENAQLLDQVQRQLEHVVALQRHNQGILESSPAGIAVIDPEDRVVSANLAFAALAGRPRGEVLGLALADLLPVTGLPAPGAGLAQICCVGADGEERHLDVSVAPFQGGEREGQRVVVLQDVSARVAMERALKDKDRLAALGVLAAGVAHEVNTPLTGISSYAQLLLAETDAADPRRELLEKVERQTFRASRIVSGLLEFARQPGRERRPVDLATVVADTAELLRERLSAKAVRFHAGATPADGAVVVGSEGELQQVFTNLMLNAIDAMAPQGGGELAVSFESRADRVVVHVEDSGPGIPEQHLGTIFEPFFTTKRGEGGTGLGLSISHNIVEQHGGRLVAENRPEGGGRFSVELPRAEKGVPPQ
jgi:signal transduction histidine kinase